MPYYFSLREEARKSWKYCVSDKLIHFSEVIDAGVDTYFSLIDRELSSTVWIELNFSFIGQRNCNYCAVVDLLAADRFNSCGLKLPFRKDAVRGDVSMLFDVPQRVQLPQISGAVVIPCVVRLKRFHDGNCFGGHSSGGLSDITSGVRIVPLTNRETNLRSGLDTAETSQLPCQMIETGPEVDNEITSNESGLQDSGVMETLNPDDVPTIFRIVFGRNLWGVQFLNSERFPCEFIEVFLRPLSLKIRVKQTRRHAEIVPELRELKG